MFDEQMHCLLNENGFMYFHSTFQFVSINLSRDLKNPTSLRDLLLLLYLTYYRRS